MDTGRWSRSMYGRGPYTRGGRAPEMEGFDFHNPGFMDFSQDTYGSSSGSWINSYDGLSRESYYDRPEGGRFGFSGPQGGYGRRPQQQPPHRGQPGWRGRGGSLKGNFRSDPSRYPHHSMSEQDLYPELNAFNNLEEITRDFHFGGGIKRNKTKKKQHDDDDDEEEEPAVKKKHEDFVSDGGYEAFESTTTDRKQEDGKQHAQSSSKSQQVTERNPFGNKLIPKILFSCSFCEFYTFYEEKMNNHLESDFHKKRLDFLGEKLPRKRAACLEENMLQKIKWTEEQRKRIPDLNNKIHKVYQSRDLTLGLGMENFVKKMDVANCAACNLLIPMQQSAIDRHIRSYLHLTNCAIMMKKTKSKMLGLTRALLRTKHLKQKVVQYLNSHKDE